MRSEVDPRRAARRAQRQVSQADWRSTLARSGLAAKGVLYGALGLLAIDVATGDASAEHASRQDAIRLVASQPFGQWLLGILTAGLFALTVWHIIQAIKGDPVEGTEMKDRVKFGAKAIIYLTTALTALMILLSDMRAGSGSAGASSGGEDQATATVMSWPGGIWIVGMVGAAVVALAVHQLYQHAWKTMFMSRLNRSAMSPEVASGAKRAGQVGYSARAIVAVIVGIFLIVAAARHDPQAAVGLSGALGAVSGEPWGPAVLWTVAVGLVLYGAFCFAEARYRRAT